MISYQEALSAVLSHTQPLQTQELAMDCTLGYALAEDIVAPFDLPTFDNSAVDGFGVRVDDLQDASPVKPTQLRLVGTICAGDDASQITIASGEAVKILTGAAIPCGVEDVVMKEYAEERDGHVILIRRAKKDDNIRRRGEEYRQGVLVLKSGTRITPPVIGLLANFGHAAVEVFRKPSVAIIVSGNELVRPGGDLRVGQIYESNSFAISAALQHLGILDRTIRRAKDDQASLRKEIDQALRRSDVLITIGGISVGDYDLVKEVLTDLAVETVFWQVAMKPGRPNFFGAYRNDNCPYSARTRLIFGLPGNPVSALVSFHQFVQPALSKMMGMNDTDRPPLEATLACNFRKKPGRVEFVRAVLSFDDGKAVVNPTQGQYSHMLSGLSQANCLMRLPHDSEFIEKGRLVPIELLDW